MSELAVSADDVAKFVRLQKAMYDSGASPQVCECYLYVYGSLLILGPKLISVTGLVKFVTVVARLV